MKTYNIRIGKKLSSFLLMIWVQGAILSMQATAQSTTAPASDTVVKKDSLQVIEETLVELALKSPNSQITDHQVKIAEYSVKTAKNSWFNLFSISTNYNDQSFSKQNTATPNIYPKYFLGVTVPLGTIFTKGSEVKSAKEGVKISEQNREILKRNLRTEILTMYKQYRANIELLRLQNELIIDEQAIYLLNEKKYSEDKVSLDVFNTASKNYNNSLISRVNLQLQQDILKLNIEELIGMRLEDAIAMAYAKMNPTK